MESQEKAPPASIREALADIDSRATVVDEIHEAAVARAPRVKGEVLTTSGVGKGEQIPGVELQAGPGAVPLPPVTAGAPAELGITPPDPALRGEALLGALLPGDAVIARINDQPFACEFVGVLDVDGEARKALVKKRDGKQKEVLASTLSLS